MFLNLVGMLGKDTGFAGYKLFDCSFDVCQ